MRDAAESLKLIDELRDRGATLIEVDGIKVVFGPVTKPKEPLEPAAAVEKAARQKAGRTLDERLLRPLNIGTAT